MTARIVILGLLAGLGLLGCETPNAVNSNTVKPTPTPTVSHFQETAPVIESYAATAYPGWTLKAVMQYGCYGTFDRDPCTALLVKDGKERVITVQLVAFEDKDGAITVRAFRARPIDFSAARLEELKDAERDASREAMVEDAPRDYDDPRQ